MPRSQAVTIYIDDIDVLILLRHFLLRHADYITKLFSLQLSYLHFHFRL